MGVLRYEVGKLPSDFQKLKSGVDNPNFTIVKFYANDRGNKVAQYIPMYKNKSLLQSQNAVYSLKEAQNHISDWHDRLVYYNKTLYKGKVHDMLKSRGMI